MGLAILEDDTIANPPIEVLFTVDEETGMYGAQALDGSLLSGKKLINIDSEEEGIFTVSCAGGVRAELTLPIEYENNLLPCFKITVDGLKGGHSGVEIHKGRFNSNKTAAAFLSFIENYKIVSINGGMKDNAIPVLTEVIIAANDDFTAEAEKFLQKNFNDNDTDLRITVTKAEKADKCFTEDSTKKTVDFLCGVPNGIIRWSDDIENLVETSLNLGVLLTKEKAVVSSFALRSSINADKNKLLDTLGEYVMKFGGKMTFEGHYPAWEYRKESPLRDVMCSLYEEITGTAPSVVAIHAGLECGLLGEKIADLDAVSIGPDMFDIHTCREKLSVSSVERVYNFIVKLLEKF